MERREQYKRIIMFLASLLIMVVQTGAFAYVWFHCYADAGVIGKKFWFRGNYVEIGRAHV